MSNQVSLPDLLMAIGADNIRFQDVRASMDSIKSKKGVTVISFATDAMTPSDAVMGTGPKGLVVWVDPHLMKQRLDELKAGNGMTMEKVVQQRDNLAKALEDVIMAGTSGSRGMRNFLAEAKKALDEVKGIAPAAGEAL
jgi:hypothetical protein